MGLLASASFDLRAVFFRHFDLFFSGGGGGGGFLLRKKKKIAQNKKPVNYHANRVLFDHGKQSVE